MMTRSHFPSSQPELPVELDHRFPSGPWCGFFLMSHFQGRHQMELKLTFRQGSMTGEGEDLIGPFLIRGRYQVEDGQCWWTKRYIGKHDVFYHGYNEGKGIWGLWEIPPNWKGGFHIWPEAMGDPNQPKLTESIDELAEMELERGADAYFETGVEANEPATVGAEAR